MSVKLTLMKKNRTILLKALVLMLVRLIVRRAYD